MKYVNFNNYEISKLALGTVQFGLNYGIANKNGQPDQKTIDTILNYVSNMGINTFDTAQAYGSSEDVIGNYLKTHHEAVKFIVSKIDSNLITQDSTHLNESVKSSIRKLGCDSLFALLMHNSHLMTKWDSECSKKVRMLKDAEIIRYFGVSIYSNSEFDLALNNEDIDVIQIPFNLFDQRALQKEWFTKAKEKNKLLFIRSIYLQGLLLMDTQNIPETLKLATPYIYEVDKFSNKLGLSKNELCLSFVNSVSKNSSILFGCETLAQAKENLSIFNNLKNLDPKVIEDIRNTFNNVDESIYNPTKW